MKKNIDKIAVLEADEGHMLHNEKRHTIVKKTNCPVAEADNWVEITYEEAKKIREAYRNENKKKHDERVAKLTAEREEKLKKIKEYNEKHKKE